MFNVITRYGAKHRIGAGIRPGPGADIARLSSLGRLRFGPPARDALGQESRPKWIRPRAILGSTSERTCPRQSLAGSNRASAHPTTHAGLSALDSTRISCCLPSFLAHSVIPKGSFKGLTAVSIGISKLLGRVDRSLASWLLRQLATNMITREKFWGSGFVSGLESARAAHLRSRRSPLRLPARTRSRPISRLASPPRQQALVGPLPIASRRIGPCSAASRVRFAAAWRP